MAGQSETGKDDSAITSEKIAVRDAECAEAAQPGDILLIRYQPEEKADAEVAKLLRLSFEAITHYQNWNAYNAAEKHAHAEALAPLFQFAVTLFDGSPFYHAELVTEGFDSFTLQNPEATLYRYRHGAIHLGDEKLPAEPVLEAANAIGSAPEAPTAFESGFLAIWSLFRGGQQNCLPVLQASLESLFGRSFTKGLLADGRAQKLATLLSDLFHKAIDDFRDTNERTGADSVVHFFNSADAEGTYRISRERKAPSGAQLHAPLAHAATHMDEQIVTPLLAAIDALNLTPPLRPVSIALALIDSDTRYSPGDIAASVSTLPALHGASEQA